VATTGIGLKYTYLADLIVMAAEVRQSMPWGIVGKGGGGTTT
jgi:hypothetical protein